MLCLLLLLAHTEDLRLWRVVWEVWKFNPSGEVNLPKEIEWNFMKLGIFRATNSAFGEISTLWLYVVLQNVPLKWQYIPIRYQYQLNFLPTREGNCTFHKKFCFWSQDKNIGRDEKGVRKIFAFLSNMPWEFPYGVFAKKFRKLLLFGESRYSGWASRNDLGFSRICAKMSSASGENNRKLLKEVVMHILKGGNIH